MKKSILLLASAALLFAGCAKVENEEVVPVPEKGKRTITLKATVDEPNTRVSASINGDKATYSWQTGDAIAVWIDDGDGGYITNDPITAQNIGNDGSTADFPVTLEEGENLGAYAFYPHSVDCGLDNDEWVFGLNPNITYVKDATNMPMLGEIKSTGASFKAVGAVIKLTINNVPADAAHLLFSAKDVDGSELAISGVFPISNGLITAGGQEGDHGVNIDFSGKRENDMVFYVPVPTGTYGGFVIEFDNANSSETLASKMVSFGTQGLTVSRNEIIVAPAMNAKTLWHEDFTGYSSEITPSEGVNKGYGGTTVSYTCYTAEGGGVTKIYNENNAGGTAPELLIGKKSGSFAVSDIPTAGASFATLTFKANGDRVTVTSTTEGITIGSKSVSNNVYSYTISFETGVTSFDLVFTNKNTGSNVRVDNFVCEAGVGEPVVVPSIYTPDDNATIAATNLAASINGVKIVNPQDDQGITATTNADWLTVVFEGGNWTEGRKLKATASSHWYGTDSRTATVTLSATGATPKTITITQTSGLVPNPVLNAEGGNADFTVTWTGHEKAASYVGYYSANELTDPSSGTPMTIVSNGNTYTAKPSGAVANGTKYYVYVKIAALIESATTYQIAEGWSSSEVTPTGVIDYTTTYRSEGVTFSINGADSNASEASVIINNVAYDAIKVGTSKNGGYMTVTVPAGKSFLHIHVAAWSGESPSITISGAKVTSDNTNSLSPSSDSGISGSSSTFHLASNATLYYKKLTLNGSSNNPREVTFSVNAGKKRFVIWGVNAE